MKKLGELPVVCVFDEAIDVDRIGVTALLAYGESRDWNAVAPFFVAGKMPKVFHLRAISTSAFLSYVATAASAEDRAARAFAASVVRVDNMLTDDGVVVSNWRPSSRAENAVLTTEEINAFAPAEVIEIGRVAYARSFLVRTTQPTYELPLSSLEILKLQTSHRAVQSGATASKPAHSDSSGSEASTTQSSGG